jgi:hypothetical protein
MAPLQLMLPPRPVTARRLGGLGVSIPLHAAGIWVVLLASAATREPVVRAVSAGPVVTFASPDRSSSSGDRPLLEETLANAIGADRSEQKPLEFDLDKLRSRRQALFPFLTTDFRFLEQVERAHAAAHESHASPFARQEQSTGTGSPLMMTDAEVQRTIDKSWSRRARWTTFAAIARLMSTHDPQIGRAPEIVRGYLDQNLLQPFCDGASRDPRYWAMLENAADHGDFIDFVRAFARQHPSSRTTTELLFLLDELAQGSRDVLLMLLDTDPDQDLAATRLRDADAHALARELQLYYSSWLERRGIHELRDISAWFDARRLQLLTTIIETSPAGYRTGDARYLAGEIAFKQGDLNAARQYWVGLEPDPNDAYFDTYMAVLAEMRQVAPDLKHVARLLQGVYGRWRVDSIDRLRKFGYSCDTF